MTKPSQKRKVAILFGGKSGEHEVSISSAISVYTALDKNKYTVVLIGIDKAGRWLLPSESHVLAHTENPRLLQLNQEKQTVSLVPFEADQQLISLQSSFGQGQQDLEPHAKHDSNDKFDVVFPILHGPHGEDGTVQGLLELSNVPYVGSGVLGSALGMDKDVSRRLLKAAGIPVVATQVVLKYEYVKNKNSIIRNAIENLGLPFFVKPANMGSSVGVYKVKTEAEAAEKIESAFLYDNKVLIEQAIDARELECAILGNDDPQASIIGEIVPQHEFYSYEAKYIDDNGALLQIPAQNIDASTMKRVQDLAIQAFKVLECSGLARVDFFMDRKTGELYLNEINTIPGFTKISMYPKLWEASGKPYAALLDHLIELALERHAKKNLLKTSFA